MARKKWEQEVVLIAEDGVRKERREGLRKNRKKGRGSKVEEIKKVDNQKRNVRRTVFFPSSSVGHKPVK